MKSGLQQPCYLRPACMYTVKPRLYPKAHRHLQLQLSALRCSFRHRAYCYRSYSLCVRASIAFFVFTTGIGHVSPIAFTVIIFIILPMLFQLVSPQNAGHAACQQICISYGSLKSVHIYRHISPLNKSSHFCSREPCGFKLVQKYICLRGFYCKQQSSGGLRIEEHLLH